MTVALHTRSVCDECGLPAIVESGDAFLCERCDREIHGAVENSVSSIGPPVDANAVTAQTSAPVPGAVTATFSVSEDVALNRVPLGGADRGESLGTSSEFNSGDGLGILEPGSITSGDRIAVTAGSGRARNRAMSPAVAGCPSTNPTPSSTAFPPEVSVNCAPVTDVPAGAPFSSVDPSPAGADLEAAVTAFEAEWTRHGSRLGIVPTPSKYATTSRMRALSDISANVVQAPSASSISTT